MLRSQLDELDGKFSTLQGESGKLQYQLSEKDDRIKSLEEEIGNLEEKSFEISMPSEKEGRIKSLEITNVELNNKIRLLEKNVQSLEQDMSETQLSNEEFANKVDHLQSYIQKLERNIADKNEKMKSENNLQQTIVQLQQTLNQEQIEVKKIRKLKQAQEIKDSKKMEILEQWQYVARKACSNLDELIGQSKNGVTTPSDKKEDCLLLNSTEESVLNSTEENGILESFSLVGISSDECNLSVSDESALVSIETPNTTAASETTSTDCLNTTTDTIPHISASTETDEQLKQYELLQETHTQLKQQYEFLHESHAQLKQQYEFLHESHAQRKIDHDKLFTELHEELDGWKKNYLLEMEKNKSLLDFLYSHDEILPPDYDQDVDVQEKVGHLIKYYQNTIRSTHQSYKDQIQKLQEEIYTQREMMELKDRKLGKLDTDYKEFFEAHVQKLQEQEKLYQNHLNHVIASKDQELHTHLSAKERELQQYKIHYEELQDQMDQKSNVQDDMSAWQMQAEIYKNDFQVEREAREKQHAVLLDLREAVEKLSTEKESYKEELNRISTQRMNERRYQPQQPSGYNSPQQQPHGSLQEHQEGNYRNAPQRRSMNYEDGNVFGRGGMPPAYRNTQEILEQMCPKCNAGFPDTETLQIHLLNCVDH